MPVAKDRRDRMFNARNLNSLYSRFDQKVARVFDNKTPIAAGFDLESYVGIPAGVVYKYSVDPSTAFYVTANSTPQSQVEIELSKLENKYLDVNGGQVYVDSYVAAFDSSFCNIAAIHKSFELHKRNIDGVDYDVHLGWDDPTGALLSYCREYYDNASSIPSLPPGRIHKHKIAVAEILLEGIAEFRILNTYQRYDCWRVHNCFRRSVTVYLQNPDGSSQRETVGPMGCRSFRRKGDGTWQTTWPDGSPCSYFFPYFRGDVPYFAGGPPIYGYPPALSMSLERSAKANNIANPFLLTQWFRALGGWLDPFLGLDIRQAYPEYADPTDANSAIGDLIFTWGRARVVSYNSTTNQVIQDYFKIFRNSTQFLLDLESIGLNVDFDGIDLILSTKEQNTTIRIYPIDCNVFFGSTDPWWDITDSDTYISTAYPATYYTQDIVSPTSATAWAVGNVPSWLETISVLRRRIAVEEGFLNAYDDVAFISEEKVGLVSLTPLGLMVPMTTSVGIEDFDANALSEVVNYERTSNIIELRTQVRPANFGSGVWSNTNYCSAIKTYHIALPSNSSGMYGHVFPQLSTTSSGSNPAVNCSYVPSQGPWGFSSSVYDRELERVYTTNPATPVTTGIFGSDFWINKWGGAGGVDASVRILGRPETTTQSTGAVDDVFGDLNNPQMACLAPWVTSAAAYYSTEAEIADIRWTYETVFNWPYSPTYDAINYDGIGPFYHKIPKSAFLWNLLEFHVRAWTRAVPLCHGEEQCPIYGFDAAGNIETTTLGVLMPKDLTLTCTTDEGPSFFITEEQFNEFLANGIAAKKLYDGVYTMTYYWVVSAVELAAYCNRMGFSSYNFDCLNQVLDGQGGLVTAATKWNSQRNYGPGETVQIASYYDTAASKEFYRQVRYVNLRLPNELSA